MHPMDEHRVGIVADLSAEDRSRPYLFIYEDYLAACARYLLNPIIIHPWLPNLSWILESLDGIVFTGGDDISHQRGGWDPSTPIVPMDKRRESLDFKLIDWALNHKIPAFGICLGMQEMGVACGAQLCPDLSQVDHPEACQHQDGAEHDLNFSGEFIQWMGGSQGRLPSYHSQAFLDLPDCLQVTARSPDGVVEAFKHKDHPFFVGVQWHAELPESEALWMAFTHEVRLKVFNQTSESF